MSLLETHFEPASIIGLIRGGHPYDFIETYQTIAALYGYRAYYVNLGLWSEGAETVEPGRKLAFAVAAPVALGEGEDLVDAGSGLGQAAVDLTEAHGLASVLGVNPNPRQVSFANDLAAQAGLSERVRHVQADACTHLATLPADSVHGVIAVECIGHFADAAGFLAGARRALAPGRRLSFCLNIAHRPLTPGERLTSRASFGFVPQTLATWLERLDGAGFDDVRTEDLTALVTGAVSQIVEGRLASPSPQVRGLPASTRFVTRRLQKLTREAVASGRLKYMLVSGRAP